MEREANSLSMNGWVRWLYAHRGELQELARILEAWQALRDEPDGTLRFRKQVILALEAAKIGVTLTETQVDDQVLRYVGPILQNEELLTLLADLAERVFRRKEDLRAEMLEAWPFGDEFEARGIPWSVVKLLIPYLLELMDLFWKSGKDY